ncbi:hypothetical protein WJX77_004975 [Trebouxia sp. C0004]
MLILQRDIVVHRSRVQGLPENPLKSSQTVQAAQLFWQCQRVSVLSKNEAADNGVGNPCAAFQTAKYYIRMASRPQVEQA